MANAIPDFFALLLMFFAINYLSLMFFSYISSIKVPPPSNITYYRKPMSAW